MKKIEKKPVKVAVKETAKIASISVVDSSISEKLQKAGLVVTSIEREHLPGSIIVPRYVFTSTKKVAADYLDKEELESVKEI